MRLLLIDMIVIEPRRRHYDNGRGICYVKDKITFVPNACVDEVLEIEIVKEAKKYNIGKIKSIIASKRQNSFCQYSDICGGCSLSLMSYEDTLGLP